MLTTGEDDVLREIQVRRQPDRATIIAILQKYRQEFDGKVAAMKAKGFSHDTAVEAARPAFEAAMVEVASLVDTGDTVCFQMYKQCIKNGTPKATCDAELDAWLNP